MASWVLQKRSYLNTSQDLGFKRGRCIGIDQQSTELRNSEPNLLWNSITRARPNRKANGKVSKSQESLESENYPCGFLGLRWFAVFLLPLSQTEWYGCQRNASRSIQRKIFQCTDMNSLYLFSALSSPTLVETWKKHLELQQSQIFNKTKTNPKISKDFSSVPHRLLQLCNSKLQTSDLISLYKGFHPAGGKG